MGADQGLSIEEAATLLGLGNLADATVDELEQVADFDLLDERGRRAFDLLYGYLG